MPWEKSLEKLGIHQKIPSILYKMLFGSVKDKRSLWAEGFSEMSRNDVHLPKHQVKTAG